MNAGVEITMDTRNRRRSPVRWMLGALLLAGGATAGLAWKPELLPEAVWLAIPGAQGIADSLAPEALEVEAPDADTGTPMLNSETEAEEFALDSAQEFPEWADGVQSEPEFTDEFVPPREGPARGKEQPFAQLDDVSAFPEFEADSELESEPVPEPRPRTVQPGPAKENPFGEVAPVPRSETPAVPPKSSEVREEPVTVSVPVPQVDLRRIEELLAAGDQMSAHLQLSEWYWKLPARRPAIQKPLDELATSIYFTPTPHFVEPYVIQPGDQLSKIARKYQLSWQYLAKLNRVEPRRIRPGQKLKVVEGPFSAVVDLSDFELTVHCRGQFVRRYRVGIGKDNASPLGDFVVKEKLENPKYWGSDGNVKEADDPLNPLGERWIDIGDSFGIHGTIDPDSIGKQESKGCIRMLNSDVEEVYDLLTVGSPVRIQR